MWIYISLHDLDHIFLYNTSSISISKHPFDFIFVPKCKPLFKLLDAFIIYFLNIPLVNTTILSWYMKSQI